MLQKYLKPLLTDPASTSSDVYVVTRPKRIGNNPIGLLYHPSFYNPSVFYGSLHPKSWTPNPICPTKQVTFPGQDRFQMHSHSFQRTVTAIHKWLSGSSIYRGVLLYNVQDFWCRPPFHLSAPDFLTESDGKSLNVSQSRNALAAGSSTYDLRTNTTYKDFLQRHWEDALYGRYKPLPDGTAKRPLQRTPRKE